MIDEAKSFSTRI